MRIMVIGGYGQVGSIVVRQLLTKKENFVVIAGRSVEKAEYLQKELKEKQQTECRLVDVEEDITGQLGDIDTVVMCLEKNNLKVLDACIATGTNYIDITPSTGMIEQLQVRKDLCVKAGIKVILGVGIAPGLSNLMAIQASSEFDNVETVETFLMLGVAESHGANAVRWLIDNINHKYLTDGKEGPEMVKSFRGKRYQILQDGKKHTFTRIDLADSLINRATFPGVKCNSWFAYDVNYFTKLVCIMQKCGLFFWLRFEKMKKLYEKTFGLSMAFSKKMHIGTDHYEVIVKVTGIKNGRKTAITKSYSGQCNNNITAKIAVAATEKIEEYEVGISYLGQKKFVNLSI